MADELEVVVADTQQWKSPPFLAGGGEMGALIRGYDWSSTALGSPSDWPQALRTAAQILLNTGNPMCIFWGEAGAWMYNDAYRQSIGPERHPGSLGLKAKLVWSEIWDIIGPQIDQVMSGRGATWHENALVPITRNGQREDVYWTYSYSPIGDETAPNGIGGVLVICTETTETVMAQQRSRAEAERQRLMFERAPGFIAILKGPEHVFEFVNDAYQQLVGGRDLIGHPVRTVFPDVAGQGFFEKLDRVYRNGERIVERGAPISFRRSIDAEAHAHEIDYVYAPVLDDTGAVSGIFVEGHDVTDANAAQEALRASEEALRHLNETLEQRVLSRTTELVEAQEALRQSQKLEAMGQLTGGVAHDFNNLLTPIIGGLDMLSRRGVGGERERRLIDGALQSAERAKTLVQRLLAFARRQPLQAEAVDVGALVRGMADLIASTSGPQVRMQVEIEEGLVAAEADPNQLEMAILNLCVNARDAMPDGGVLTLSAGCKKLAAGEITRLPAGSYIRIRIADTGVGMDEATVARAVEPFFSTKGIGKGTGLGLSMVHGLASQLSGALTIASKPGLGTTVDLWLPVSEDQAAETTAAASASDHPHVGRCLLTTTKILSGPAPPTC